MPDETAVQENAAPADARPWKPGLLLVLILGLFYGALQNGLWVPVSDGDAYLAIARNLATGKGFVFNGFVVEAMPPGWPFFLAGAMKISGSFLFLNLLPMALMLIALLLFYRLLLRLTTPGRALAVCLVTGILSHVYHRTFMLHSEALFCVIATAALLLALQVNEGRRATWRIPLLLILCVFSVVVRWAGVLMIPVVAAALLNGRRRLRLDRFWATAVIAGILMLGTFFALRMELKEIEPGAPAPKDAGSYATRPHTLVGRVMKGPRRLLSSGRWYAGLLAEPLHLGMSLKPVAVAGNLAGWGLIALFVLGMIPFLRERNWLLLGAFLYTLGVVVLWTKPVPRYFVPVAPFLLLGLWNGLDRLARAPDSKARRRIGKALLIALVAGTALGNLSLYAVDVWMIHSRDFYANYQAGNAEALINVAHVINTHAPLDATIARDHNELAFVDRSPSRSRLFDLRGLHLLTNRIIMTAPDELEGDGPDEAHVAWATEKGARFYIHRPPVSPWQVWHFRAPWLQEWVTGEPVGEPNPLYELYELKDGEAVRVRIPDVDHPIRTVPHL